MSDAKKMAEDREKLLGVVDRIKRIRASLPPDSPLVQIVWRMEALSGEIDAALHAEQLRQERDA